MELGIVTLGVEQSDGSLDYTKNRATLDFNHLTTGTLACNSASFQDAHISGSIPSETPKSCYCTIVPFLGNLTHPDPYGVTLPDGIDDTLPATNCLRNIYSYDENSPYGKCLLKITNGNLGEYWRAKFDKSYRVKSVITTMFTNSDHLIAVYVGD